MIGYVVEKRLTTQSGARGPLGQIWVATETRAREVAAGIPGASYRQVPYDQMPEAARLNLERAAAAGA